MIFDYPDARQNRRHGPRGYARYASYRPWLRDEFTFRCVWCLKREQWGQVTGEFDIDHFQPQARRPDLASDYANLVYSCRRCNAVKLDQVVADPFAILTSGRIRGLPDGSVRGLDEAAARLILQLDLNSPKLIEWRVIWMRVVDLAREHDAGLLRRLVGFPADLPDLARMRPPRGNARPDGIDQCSFALAKQGKLPAHY